MLANYLKGIGSFFYLKILKVNMNLSENNMNQNIFYIYALYKNQSINQTENLNKNENENIE